MAKDKKKKGKKKQKLENVQVSVANETGGAKAAVEPKPPMSRKEFEK